jgi:hypothetical protein
LVTDLGGTPDDAGDDYLAALDREADEPAHLARTRALRVREDTDIESLPPLQWLAAGVIPQASVAVLYGPPGAGKSFVSIALALSVATGVTWLGHGVAGGGALYCAAEGLAGLGQRIRAWKRSHGFEAQSTRRRLRDERVNLLEPSAAARIAKVVETSSASRVAGPAHRRRHARALDDRRRERHRRYVAGSLRRSTRYATATNATVLFVHHTRKDSDVERGSSALRGGVDTLIFCQEGDDGRQLVCQKQKDAEAFAPIPFVLVAGHGSCVVTSTGVGSSAGLTGPGAHLTPQRLKALRTLAEHFTTRGATVTEWLKASDIAERTFYRVRTYLARFRRLRRRKRRAPHDYRARARGGAATRSCCYCNGYCNGYCNPNCKPYP